ncbi:hypothetical protein Gohar_003452 [Gossypium harknessii]|uniref:Malectin-like domain-containing protein n=1 Tax=Gossypium harknessii TaxID=34285 RepID=A0A7J9HP00_9ROSI|nr:hypothetical protein [Gossypium harknessii]
MVLLGFISLDCGLPTGSSYTDSITGINYTSDEPYIQTGTTHSLSRFNSSIQQQFLENLRSFPQGVRHCYQLNLTKGEKYLIRASFMYGNYDENDENPEFDLYLGPNLWASMVFENSTSVVVKEIIYVVKARYLHVCVVNTGKGIPFISALESRLLSNLTYNTDSETQALEFFLRIDFGSSLNSSFRFPEDIYDRIWQPYRRNDLTTINSSSSLISNSIFDPPLMAMMTASIPMNGSQTLNFTVRDSDPAVGFYFYMHFVELEELQANQTREFNIYLNDDFWYGPFSPKYLRGDTILSFRSVKGGQFSMESTRSSTHPPIINAFEAYKVKELVESQTVEREGRLSPKLMNDFLWSIVLDFPVLTCVSFVVNAMMNIKSMYRLKKNWEGDPCFPRTYSWEGLGCSYDDLDLPRIISLNLSSSGLSGEISPYIGNLTQLQYLDLSNNNLTGGVPEFLTRLQFLTLM